MTTTGSLVTASATAAVANSYYFSLSDLDSYTTYTAMFDQYRIEAVEFKVMPMQNSITLQTNSTTTPVRFYCVVDYDDAGSITSEANARSYESCVIVPPGIECNRIFKPRVAIAAYSGSFGGYTNMAAPWIDTVSPNVQHYGIKTYIPGATASQTLLQSWTIERTYWLSFRKVDG